jgi:hypothetical protein
MIDNANKPLNTAARPGPNSFSDTRDPIFRTPFISSSGAAYTNKTFSRT